MEWDWELTKFDFYRCAVASSNFQEVSGVATMEVVGDEIRQSRTIVSKSDHRIGHEWSEYSFRAFFSSWTTKFICMLVEDDMDKLPKNSMKHLPFYIRLWDIVDTVATSLASECLRSMCVAAGCVSVTTISAAESIEMGLSTQWSFKTASISRHTNKQHFVKISVIYNMITSLRKYLESSITSKECLSLVKEANISYSKLRFSLLVT